MSETPSVLCIDIGNLNTICFEANDKSVSVRTDPTGKRSCPSSITFTKDSRRFGNLTVNVTCSNEKTTVYEFIKGLNTNDPQFEFKGYQYTPEELTSYFMKHLLGENAKYDKVAFSIPSWWGDFQRQKFLDAMNLAGINGEFINSTKAFALDYYARFPQAEDAPESYCMISDSGSVGTSIAFYKMSKGEITLLSYKYVPIGGEHFTMAFANYLLNSFAESEDEKLHETVEKIKNKEDPRLSRIFLNAARTAKENLVEEVENTFDAVGISTEFDMRKQVKLSDLQSLKVTEAYLAKIAEAYSEAFKEAQIPEGTELKCAEICGGNGRSALIKKTVSETLNIPQVTSFLTSCDALSEGVGFFKQGMEVNYTEKIAPFKYENRDGVVFAVPDRSVILEVSGEDFADEGPYQIVDTIKEEYQIYKVSGEPNFEEKNEYGILSPQGCEENYIETSNDEKEKFAKHMEDLDKSDKANSEIADLLDDLTKFSLQFPSELEKMGNDSLKAQFAELVEESSKFYERNKRTKNKSRIETYLKKLSEQCSEKMSAYINEQITKLKDVKENEIPKKKSDENADNKWKEFKENVTKSIEDFKTYNSLLQKFGFQACEYDEAELTGFLTSSSNVLSQFEMK